MTRGAAILEVAVTLPLRGTFTYRDPRRGAARVPIGTQVVVPFGTRTVTGFVVGHDATAADETALKDIEEVVAGAPAFDEAMIAFCRWVADYYYAPLGEVLRAALPQGEKAAAVRAARLTARGRAALEGGQRSLLGPEDAGGGHPRARARSRPRAASSRCGRLARASSRAGRRSSRASRSRASSRWATRCRRAARAAHGGVRRRRRGRVRRAAARARRGAGGRVLAARRGRRRRGRPRDGPARRAMSARTSRRSSTRGSCASSGGRSRAPRPRPRARPPRSRSPSRSATPSRRSRARSPRASRRSSSTASRARARPRSTCASSRRRAPPGAARSCSCRRSRSRRSSPRASPRGSARTAPCSTPRCRRASASPPGAGCARARWASPWARARRSSRPCRRWASSSSTRSTTRRSSRRTACAITGATSPSCARSGRAPSRSSARPRHASLGETAHNAARARFTLLPLPGRATPGGRCPTGRGRRPQGNPLGPDGILSARLAEAIGGALAQREQVILFLNRRGFSSIVRCRECGDIVKCDDCSVSMTFHRGRGRLICHYCGSTKPVLARCSKCGSGKLDKLGMGTERVEAVIKERFPEARVARLDRDTAASFGVGGEKRGLQAVINGMNAGEIDILIGTQMVTKGHRLRQGHARGRLAAGSGDRPAAAGSRAADHHHGFFFFFFICWRRLEVYGHGDHPMKKKIFY